MDFPPWFQPTLAQQWWWYMSLPPKQPEPGPLVDVRAETNEPKKRPFPTNSTKPATRRR